MDFYGETYTGLTDANGIFRTGWAVKVTRGTHYADVVNLVMGSYTWDRDLDMEDDSDDDTYIDDFFTKQTLKPITGNGASARTTFPLGRLFCFQTLDCVTGR